MCGWRLSTTEPCRIHCTIGWCLQRAIEILQRVVDWAVRPQRPAIHHNHLNHTTPHRHHNHTNTTNAPLPHHTTVTLNGCGVGVVWLWCGCGARTSLGEGCHLWATVKISMSFARFFCRVCAVTELDLVRFNAVIRHTGTSIYQFTHSLRWWNNFIVLLLVIIS